MSFRDKAREVREAGAEARGDYTATGAPLRLYQYWLANSRSGKARRVKAGTERENFCHYWRVVFFWSHATRLRIKLGPLGSFLDRHFDAIFGTVLGIFSLVALGTVGYELWQLFLEYGWTFVWQLAVSLVGVALVLFVGFWIIYGLVSLFETWRAYSRRKRANRPIEYTYEEPEPAEWVDIEPRQPGRIARFFTAIGDFLVLIAQVIRVNKWKICPLIEVNPNVNLEK